MKLAIMQPYFLPYIGYFQLIAAADLFIIYDNIKYTKKGWINRNRMLQNDRDVMFSLPLKSAPDQNHVRDRMLAADFKRDKLLNQFRGAYSRAPFFGRAYAALERILRFEDNRLFEFLHHSLTEICTELRIHTPIRISSTVPIDHGLKGQDKVIALAKAVGASTYINPPGGQELYSQQAFRSQGIELQFLRPSLVEYRQFGGEFVPWLSIIDVMMFVSPETVSEQFLLQYELI